MSRKASNHAALKEADYFRGVNRMVMARNEELQAENEKLRELIRDMSSVLFDCGLDVYPAPQFIGKVAYRMAELGIEVDE